MRTITLVHVTVADMAAAERIAEQMIAERLAACASLAPVRSVYRWQGEIARAEEAAVTFKTANDRAEPLVARLAALHAYDLPVIERWRAEVSDDAALWVIDATKT